MSRGSWASVGLIAQKRGFVMTKQDMIERMAKGRRSRKRAAGRALESYLNAVGEELRKTGRLSLAGFGTSTACSAGTGRGGTPRRAAPYRSRPVKVVRFKAARTDRRRQPMRGTPKRSKDLRRQGTGGLFFDAPGGADGHRGMQSLAETIEDRMDPLLKGILHEAGLLAEAWGSAPMPWGARVRDLLLGRDNVDLDIVVEGEGIRVRRTTRRPPAREGEGIRAVRDGHDLAHRRHQGGRGHGPHGDL
jgi:DNA-binding protein HU-beta